MFWFRDGNPASITLLQISRLDSEAASQDYFQDSPDDSCAYPELSPLRWLPFFFFFTSEHCWASSVTHWSTAWPSRWPLASCSRFNFNQLKLDNIIDATSCVSLIQMIGSHKWLVAGHFIVQASYVQNISIAREFHWAMLTIGKPQTGEVKNRGYYVTETQSILSAW